MWAVWFPPSPCQRRYGSANTRRSSSKALNKVPNLFRVHWRRPQRVLQDWLGGWHEKNLTLFNWMTVYAYVDTLPHPIKQVDVVKYFATRSKGPLISPNPHCHANYNTAQRWKHMWVQMPMHYQANNHELSQDQMWIVPCACGFNTWSRSKRSSMVGCLLQSKQCSRVHWMSQRMNGSLDQDGFNHSVGCE